MAHWTEGITHHRDPALCRKIKIRPISLLKAHTLFEIADLPSETPGGYSPVLFIMNGHYYHANPFAKVEDFSNASKFVRNTNKTL